MKGREWEQDSDERETELQSSPMLTSANPMGMVLELTWPVPSSPTLGREASLHVPISVTKYEQAFGPAAPCH